MLAKSLIAGLCACVLLLASGRDTRVAEAAEQGDSEAVRGLLIQGADVNAALGDGTTALHWAVFHDDLELVRLLLKAGANTKAALRVDASTPLFMAASNGNASVIEALLKAGAEVNAATANGATPLMRAASAGSVPALTALLKSGADVNSKEPVHGQTALMFAAVENRSEAIKLLMERGADPTITTSVAKLERPNVDEDGNPLPVRAAGEGGRAGAGRRAFATVSGGNTALLLAARDGHFAAVKTLVEAGADVNQANAGDQSTPILIAICNGHYEIAKYLLDKGANVNQTSADGLAPLYAVIDTQWAPVGWAPNPITMQEKVKYLDLMTALIDRGANVNARLTKKLWFRPTHHDQMWIGSAGSTAFWRAAQAKDLPAMRLLIARGADPKIPTDDGANALMVAAGLGWAGNFSVDAPFTPLEAVKYCLELGLHVNLHEAQGYTALAGAAYRGDNGLVKLLVEHGAQLDARTSRGWSVTDMANGPSIRTSVPVAHPDTVALLRKLGAPELTAVDGEEILGIIKRRPAAKESK